MLFQLPRECRTFVAINPALQWGWSEILTNKINYLLETIIWQNATPHKKAQIAAHKSKAPKPFVPNFMQSSVQKSSSEDGADQMSLDDVKSWLETKRGV